MFDIENLYRNAFFVKHEKETQNRRQNFNVWQGQVLRIFLLHLMGKRSELA